MPPQPPRPPEPQTKHQTPPEKIPEIQPPTILAMNWWGRTKRAIRGQIQRVLTIAALSGTASAGGAIPVSEEIQDIFPEKTPAVDPQKIDPKEEKVKEQSMLGKLEDWRQKLSTQAKRETMGQLEQIEAVKNIKEVLDFYEKTKNFIHENAYWIAFAALFLVIFNVLNKLWPSWKDPAVKHNIEALAGSMEVIRLMINSSVEELSPEKLATLKEELEKADQKIKALIRYRERKKK